MSMAVITSKGRITIPRAIRESLALKPADRIVVIAEVDHAILYPLRGTILDVAASVKNRSGKKPSNFRAIRRKVRFQVAKHAVRRGR
ncbi:MAG: AbrB/MazE/SpoVT family DNA-binding domain-containing protein [candidate division NC10 bacterium]|nr:AbrB/MazE/SpoVT family DNA-binding domain-containing protein [candidate division NC10 bacterium]MBI2455869.1 AbrB/MazE/SpoVT family DNA-binding domain-containing protein [candidate division NC10 bacterium]